MLIGYLIIILSILVDQVTKRIAVTFIKDGDPVTLIPRMLEFHYYENDGISFGMLPGQQLFLAAVTVVALGMFGYLFLDVSFKDKKVYSISIALFIGGTLGNALDRALYGYVIDHFYFPFLSPILSLVNLSNFYNNFADLFLSAAIVLFMVDLFFLEPKRTKGKRA
ncbi:MAG: signal peptidase II [Acholeplasmataceae bacterium]